MFEKSVTLSKIMVPSTKLGNISDSHLSKRKTNPKKTTFLLCFSMNYRDFSVKLRLIISLFQTVKLSLSISLFQKIGFSCNSFIYLLINYTNYIQLDINFVTHINLIIAILKHKRNRKFGLNIFISEIDRHMYKVYKMLQIMGLERKQLLI